MCPLHLFLRDNSFLTFSLKYTLLLTKMAFFGLTALGPQNSFQNASKCFRNLQIFDEADFTAAWNRVNGAVDAKFCHISKLGDVMRTLYRGPVPANDNEVLVVAFEEESKYFETPNVLSFVTYIRVMQRLAKDAEREEALMNDTPLSVCEYNSSLAIQQDMLRNKRCNRNPQEKQIQPLTSAQEFGWAKQELVRPSAGKPGSDITKFAAELIKNGVYY